ncbi:MAG: hypothetical protein Q8M29_05840 [Bacteroidota bacterium]|nr:hypothetical protein [Bacteroidota bacterium]
MKKLSGILFLALVFVFACKKYPEDDRRFLFKSPKARLTKHTWKVEQLSIDGIDSTQKMYHEGYFSPATDYNFGQVEVKFDAGKWPEDMGVLFDLHVIHTTPYTIGGQSGAWEFADDKNKLMFFFRNSETQTNTFKLNGSYQSWNILCLTNEKLIIETVESVRKIKFTFAAK